MDGGQRFTAVGKARGEVFDGRSSVADQREREVDDSFMPWFSYLGSDT